LEESWLHVQEMRRLNGRRKSVLVVPESGTYKNYESIMGLLRESVGVARTGNNIRRASFTVRQRL
jgi:hypothetical protein